MYDIPVLTFKLLLVSWITAERQSIHERTASRNIWDDCYDFIIVGAGSAGCAIAHRLTENPNVKVLLLEAGGPQSAIYTDIPQMAGYITDDRSDLQWNYYNEPQKVGKRYLGNRIFEPRGKVIGGSSSHNYFIFNRGNRRDYDNWANKYGAIGWNFDAVLPFFRLIENNTDPDIVRANPQFHGTNGPIQISSAKRVPRLLKIQQKVYNEIGFKSIDFNGPEQTGTMIMQYFIDANGFRSSNGNAYIDPNPHKKNLHILSKALVSKILFNNVTAIGVEFSRNSIQYRVFARKEVILTAGAINTPQILMLSGIGIPEHLKKFDINMIANLPVGNNFMNHPGINFEVKILKPSLFGSVPTLSIRALSEFYFNKSGSLVDNPLLGIYFSTSPEYKDWPNGLLFTQVNNDRLGLSFNQVRVRSRGTVRLQSSSPYIPPAIDSSFLSDPLDFKESVEGMRFILRVLEKTRLSRYLQPFSFETVGCPTCPGQYNYLCDPGIKCFIEYIANTTYHTVGGCRMGRIDRDDVVVDPYLRVKYVNNLRVCDSSVFPENTNGNTNSPATMVGERCAQIIKQTYDFN